MTVRTTVTDGGLTVVTEAMPQVRSLSIGFWVGTGSQDEAPTLAGASHFLEHLLFKGTENRSARSIAEAIDEVGGDMNAFTTKEYTAFYIRLLADSTDLALDILSDIIWSPAFRPDEVEAERQVILEEILMHGDEPADLVHDVFAAARFPDHPLGREVLGAEDTIEAMSRDQIAEFHAQHYHPTNLVVAAAGDLDHDDIVAGVIDRTRARVGGDLPVRSAPAAAPVDRAVVRRPTEQAHVVVGVGAPSRNDEERHAISVVDHVMGGGMSSRMFQAIREERGLAYSVYSYRLAFTHAGAFAVYAGTSPAQVGQVLDLIHEGLNDMAVKGITPAELDSARSYLRGSLALGLEDSGARMSRLGHSQLVHGRVLEVEEIEARLGQLEADDINDVAARWLSTPRTIAAVGPFDHEDALLQ